MPGAVRIVSDHHLRPVAVDELRDPAGGVLHSTPQNAFSRCCRPHPAMPESWYPSSSSSDTPRCSQARRSSRCRMAATSRGSWPAWPGLTPLARHPDAHPYT
jgi:hypothetical protein